MNPHEVRLSKFLSLALRHRPEVIGARLDQEGWLEVDVLLEKASAHGTPMSLETLHELVATNDKRRFVLSEDGLRIRANQGHSVPGVDLGLIAVEPPESLYHGTIAAFLPSIQQLGLSKRSRQHVHLSADVEIAAKVGRRRGKPVILTVQSAAMHSAGHAFYLSANDVWLTEHVPVKFLTFPIE